MVRAEQAAGHPVNHHPQTNPLQPNFNGYARLPLFSGGATPLTNLVREGRFSILMVPPRIGHDLRRVLTRLLIRRIMKEREEASQIRNRLDLQTFDGADRTALESKLTQLVPRTVLAIDKAQELVGDEGQEARRALEDFCLLGRNYGLSMVLATQRPGIGAISAKVRAQVDTMIIHRLMTQEDIDLTYRDLQAPWPKEVKIREALARLRRRDPLARRWPGRGEQFAHPARAHTPPPAAPSS